MTGIEVRPSSFPWPPLLYLGAAAAAVVLHWLAPLPWIRGTFGEFLFGFGWLVVGGALAIAVSAVRAMRRAGTAIAAHHGADHLVTAGPFSFTRNPIYLGGVMLLFGIGLVTGIGWFFALALVAGFAVQKLAVEPEEKHLQARFGKRYRDYAKRVRRWI